MTNPGSKEVVVIDRREREIIPCPDGREDCEVLHLAPISEDEPPERISINPAVAARYPVTDKRVGDIEYTRTSTDSAGAMVDENLVRLIVNAVSMTVERVEGGCSLNVKRADELVREVLLNAAASSPAAPKDEATGWLPIETCPDNTTVLFWDRGPRIGRMEHNCLRMDDTRQDHFWGGEFDDDSPPTHWRPLPAPPVTIP